MILIFNHCLVVHVGERKITNAFYTLAEWMLIHSTLPVLHKEVAVSWVLILPNISIQISIMPKTI